MKSKLTGKILSLLILLAASLMVIYVFKTLFIDRREIPPISGIVSIFVVLFLLYGLYFIFLGTVRLFSKVFIAENSICIVFFGSRKKFGPSDISEIKIYSKGNVNIIEISTNKDTIIFNDRIWIGFSDFASEVRENRNLQKLIKTG